MVRIPSLFIGHGSPENAVVNSPFPLKWSEIAKSFPRPAAILVISAHWFIPNSEITAMEKPQTIHDFGPGFNRALYSANYAAPGSPELAENVRDLLKLQTATDVKLNNDTWGLDHGAWSVLTRMYPEADIPVVQLSLNSRASSEQHFEFGRALAPLRDQGVLILASGSLVHNLYDARFGEGAGGTSVAYAEEFNDFIKDNLQYNGPAKTHPLVRWEQHPVARKAHPTPEHYLPLLYTLGVASESPSDSVTPFLAEDFDLGTISMLSVRVG